MSSVPGIPIVDPVKLRAALAMKFISKVEFSRVAGLHYQTTLDIINGRLKPGAIASLKMAYACERLGLQDALTYPNAVGADGIRRIG